MARLLTIDNPEDEKLLRRRAKRVKNVQATKIVLAIQEMKRVARQWEHETDRRCEGLAAPQIGINLRILILRKNDWMSPPPPETQEFVDSPEGALARADYAAMYREWQRRYGGIYDPWMVMVNPTILQQEGEQDSIEQCLSVPTGSYQVTRPTHVAFRFTRDNRTYSGVHLATEGNAIKLMHEFDHLNGRLIDEAGTAIIGQKADAL
jgi:peptide deformylase